MSTIDLVRVAKRYGATVAVDDVSLHVAQGELVTILGPSGSGKTTLLTLIAGLGEPSAGQILLGGRDVTRLPAARRNVGLVFQSYALFPHMSVFDNVAFPLSVRVPMSFSSASSLQFPPPGFSLRWYEAFFGDPRWLLAARNSFLIALASSTLALVLGSIAAYGLVRGSFRGRALLEGNFIAPLILPPVITAVALYIFFARIGLLGTMPGLILAHTVLAVPYVVLLMSVAIRSFDVRIEQVAFSLGASWFTMFRRVLLPNLLPSVFAAWIFAFIISFDEVIVTLFLAGAYDTIPKRMFNELILQVNPTITAIATLLSALSTVTIAAVALLMHRAGVLGRTLR